LAEPKTKILSLLVLTYELKDMVLYKERIREKSLGMADRQRCM